MCISFIFQITFFVNVMVILRTNGYLAQNSSLAIWVISTRLTHYFPLVDGEILWCHFIVIGPRYIQNKYPHGAQWAERKLFGKLKIRYFSVKLLFEQMASFISTWRWKRDSLESQNATWIKSSIVHCIVSLGSIIVNDLLTKQGVHISFLKPRFPTLAHKGETFLIPPTLLFSFVPII